MDFVTKLKYLNYIFRSLVPAILTDMFCGFPTFFHPKSGIIPLNRP
jgi:hypothetical protein